MNTFVFDIGKTNLKCQLLSGTGATLWSISRPNPPVIELPYAHFDIDAIWNWLLDSLRTAAGLQAIGAVNISTHGACAVLLTESGKLALPVVDYEYPGLDSGGDDYDRVRPPFEETLSPRLPTGLNLGRQLWWLRQNFPREFAQTETILLYPQYWAWRLSGTAAAERTSLGCHTDLWQPIADEYSALVDLLGIRHTLPPLVDNRQPLGTISREVAALTKLPESCQVYPGVHDSNASLACHLHAHRDKNDDCELTVISAGTWVVTMAMGTSTDHLIERRDMLANVSVQGRPVACGRFMGGREFEKICELTGAALSDEVTVGDIQQIVEDGAFALPNFAQSSGPFATRRAEITGAVKNGKALATLYIALMIDLELELLDASGRVVFGSTAKKNPLICQLLAQMRPDQEVLSSGEEAGTVKGCWALTHWYDNGPTTSYNVVTATKITQLDQYRREWRALAER